MRKAFTLIELLIVLTIIAIIATVVIQNIHPHNHTTSHVMTHQVVQHRAVDAPIHVYSGSTGYAYMYFTPEQTFYYTSSTPINDFSKVVFQSVHSDKPYQNDFERIDDLPDPVSAIVESPEAVEAVVTPTVEQSPVTEVTVQVTETVVDYSGGDGNIESADVSASQGSDVTTSDGGTSSFSSSDAGSSSSSDSGGGGGSSD